jgi:hypothetical protein
VGEFLSLSRSGNLTVLFGQITFCAFLLVQNNVICPVNSFFVINVI